MEGTAGAVEPDCKGLRGEEATGQNEAAGWLPGQVSSWERDRDAGRRAVRVPGGEEGQVQSWGRWGVGGGERSSGLLPQRQVLSREGRRRH